MFSKQPSPTFTKFVSGFVPGRPEDGLIVTYKHKTKEEYDAWHKSRENVPLHESLPEVIQTWSDAPSEYSPAELKEITNVYPAFPVALLQAYASELFAVQQKN